MERSRLTGRYCTFLLASRSLHLMPWRFEERTSLAVPRRGLSWRHLKASTQSTNKIRGQPGAPSASSRQARCAPQAPHTHPVGRRQPQCPCLSRGRGDRKTLRLLGSGAQKKLMGTGDPPSLRSLPCSPVCSGRAPVWGVLGHGVQTTRSPQGPRSRGSPCTPGLGQTPERGNVSTPRTTYLDRSPPQAPQAYHFPFS